MVYQFLIITKGMKQMTKNEIIERLTSIYESMLIDDENNEAINQAIDLLNDYLQREQKYESVIDEMAKVIDKATGEISDAGGGGCDICPLYRNDCPYIGDTCANNIANYYKRTAKLIK